LKEADAVSPTRDDGAGSLKGMVDKAVNVLCKSAKCWEDVDYSTEVSCGVDASIMSVGFFVKLSGDSKSMIAYNKRAAAAAPRK
jgi:hypothetical protein